MKTFIFASNNKHKAEEIKSILHHQCEIITLKEAGITIDIPEPHHTLQENASEKSTVIFKLTGSDCFSEDSGLEVVALGGAPGVRSARYAGEKADDEKNIDKLLKEMSGVENRNACFRTVISLILDGKEYFFEGRCEGQITTERKGSNGFGYDPVFIPSGQEKTFAEMSIAEKTNISHRKKAAEKMALLLEQHFSRTTK
ncbi:MAG: RdgB/HAM1 family non-canonical purine NTP pyrophosphatase [bacterium]